MTIPTVGRIVHYQTDGRGGKRYTLPAIVTCVRSSHPDVEQPDDANPVPIPPDDMTAHLHVLTPGPQGAYTELLVPFDDSDEPAPRTWRWPTRA